MRYICNPMNIEYRYQWLAAPGQDPNDLTYRLHREAADPSIVYFKNQYYMFPSLAGGFFTGTDLEHWTFHPYLNEMPIYDYAPDVHVRGEYIYFCASKAFENCNYYRSKDPCTEPFEEITGTFPFWDPAVFEDEDGRVYFYWSCSNYNPIFGVELDPVTMKPLSEPIAMMDSDIEHRGYERVGDDHIAPKSEEEILRTVNDLLQHPESNPYPREENESDEAYRKKLTRIMGNYPYLEGAWVTKDNGKYYLQYAITGTEYNVYGDGCYVSDHPLGPYVPAKNNPYSYMPGGFVTGAGHGSTFKDTNGQWYHAATSRICMNYAMERRLGLWKAGIDEDLGLYCDQRYGSWPMDLDAPAFTKPDWMLLSYQKDVTVSSGKNAEAAVDENIRTWWQADTNKSGEWIQLDLGRIDEVHAVQVNFADDVLELKRADANPRDTFGTKQWMDMERIPTRWLLEGSADGSEWSVLCDKRDVDTDLSHDFIVFEKAQQIRFVRLTIISVPYEQKPCISGLRVFGLANETLPEKADVTVTALTGMDMQVSWNAGNTVGAVISWGCEPDKLYHSCMVYGKQEQRIGALVEGQDVYVRVDTFNESGITDGDVCRLNRIR